MDIKTVKINERITAPELRLIDEQGSTIGVFSKEEALKMAKEKGIDLIEIAPNAKPPVARLISFDKYRYQQEKALKKERASERTGTMKQVQISARAAQNDLQTKIHKLEEFMGNGYTVEIQMRLRGREKYNKPWAMQKLDEFMKMIPVEYKVITAPKFAGRGIQVQIMKKK